MKTCITLREFVALPKPVREQLRQIFRIAKSGPMEIVNGEIISDGSTAADLQKLDVGALIAFLGPDSGINTEGLFDRLLSIVLLRFEADRLEAERKALSLLPTATAVVPPVMPTEPVIAVVPAPPVTQPDPQPAADVPKPFCDSCDSKGMKHKKVCPKSN
ncbi:MAG: hypothetical protein E6Q97_07265 [Desulfurellales bacterium]|nr:MAG: hypothetical protein E6Q97_07265 [Desulfurellales bacterium]